VLRLTPRGPTLDLRVIAVSQPFLVVGAPARGAPIRYLLSRPVLYRTVPVLRSVPARSAAETTSLDGPFFAAVDAAGSCRGGRGRGVLRASAVRGRRLIIDGAVKDERSVKTLNAYTFCLDESG
jgi:hypothetical protein